MSGRRDHYSYTVYADPDLARTFDDRRFGGPIGEFVAAEQARVLVEFIGSPKGRTVLDVGTGTGRAALLLAGAGARVTGVDASEEMLAVARRRAAQAAAGAGAGALHIEFAQGDAHALDFRDRSFEVVVSLRVLMHTPEWRACLAELCRVSNRLVVFDYPRSLSVAAIQSTARRLAHAAGARTEPYRVFTDRDVAAELARAGFRVRSTHRLFVLPIALHKTIGSRRFTEWSERLLARVGLLRLLGSPATLVAERCASS